MREAKLTIRALDVAAIAAAALEAGLYNPEPNAEGKLEPLNVEDDVHKRGLPCFEVDQVADRSGPLLYVTARGDDALDWLHELASSDTAAQTDLQRARFAQRRREQELQRKAELELQAQRAADARELELAQAEEAAAAERAAVPAPSVSVTMTEPTDWVPADELDDDVDEPAPAPPEARPTPTDSPRALRRKKRSK